MVLARKFNANTQHTSVNSSREFNPTEYCITFWKYGLRIVILTQALFFFSSHFVICIASFHIAHVHRTANTNLCKLFGWILNRRIWIHLLLIKNNTRPQIFHIQCTLDVYNYMSSMPRMSYICWEAANYSDGIVRRWVYLAVAPNMSIAIHTQLFSIFDLDH